MRARQWIASQVLAYQWKERSLAVTKITKRQAWSKFGPPDELDMPLFVVESIAPAVNEGTCLRYPSIVWFATSVCLEYMP